MVGSSPLGIFVGQIGCHYIYAGPLVPQVEGYTSLCDFTKNWLGRTADDIIEFKTIFIRGEFGVNVKKPWINERFISKTLMSLCLEILLMLR